MTMLVVGIFGSGLIVAAAAKWLYRSAKTGIRKTFLR
jgi:hypothetical protein